jgi:hypothetical protein
MRLTDCSFNTAIASVAMARIDRRSVASGMIVLRRSAMTRAGSVSANTSGGRPQRPLDKSSIVTDV